LEVYYETWKAFGAGPVVVPWAEAYVALKQGVVDGMDSPLSSVYGQKFFEVAPYIVMTNHQIDPYNVLVSEKAYKALPDDLKAVITSCAREAGDWYSQLVVQSYEEEKAMMIQAGAKFIEIDTTEFVQRALPLAQSFENRGLWSKGLFEAISALK
ncbi:MAG: TRAP transporter substrate-binding protein, partial [Firmicutes bacterium]|nr:TRAP transporter substrate-binding protein [Bacillota bacterium]